MRLHLFCQNVVEEKFVDENDLRVKKSGSVFLRQC